MANYHHDFRSKSYKYNLFGQTHHIYSAVLAIVDLVVSDNGTTIRPDLDPCQGVAVDVISFDEASAVAKYINAALVAVKNGVAPTSTAGHVLGWRRRLIVCPGSDSGATLTLSWDRCWM